jgi:putative membrane-bound dehydrogenase-like protein
MTRSSLQQQLSAAFLVCGACTVFVQAGRAQAGDRPGETQPDLPADLVVPPAPPLSAADEAKTFALPPGFAIELVASEPLIQAPVQAVFDEDGRLWVVEMRGFMPNADGKGEREPVGRISVLTDDDGDGRMDRVTVFQDGLVLPRAVAPTHGGVLVIAPPKVLFCKDTDGDGKCDEQTVVDTGIGGLDSPEYGPNGLLPTLDNAFQCANHDVRYLFVDGHWTKQRTPGGGQWGITKDDLGRIYFNNNSDFLRADFVASQYLARNANLDASPLVNAACAADQATFPARITPGVNRAYTEGWLKDWKLKHSDAACGPLVYRGAAFPPEFHGDAFVCEPAGNLVKRLRFEEKPPMQRSAKSAWPDRDFLTSTDERFRPVNLSDGPDGALYVVDMYRGILQHRQFMTTFLRKQVLARGLDQATDRGRIWRVVHASMPRAKVPKLSGLESADLAKVLESSNGWMRDTAQRLFVEGAWDEAKAVPNVREVALHSKSKLARIHALWALAGMKRLDAATCQHALEERDVDVRITGLRVNEPLTATDRGAPIQFSLTCAAGTDARLAQQAFATLSGAIDPGVLANLILRDAKSAENRRAVASGLGANQLLFLNACLLSLCAPDHVNWDETGGRAELLTSLAKALVREGKMHDIDTLLNVFVPRPGLKTWAKVALLDGAAAGAAKGPKGGTARIRLSAEPKALLALLESPDEALASKLAEFSESIAWPGRADIPAEDTVRALNADENARFERGRQVFAAVCASCHLGSGLGDPAQAPPLRSSEIVLGDPSIPARIVFGGLRGPVTVGGRSYDLEMPAWNGTEEEIASVLTYVRREWGHGADPVSVEIAHAAREATLARKAPYTWAELKAAKTAPRAGDASTPGAPAKGGDAPKKDEPPKRDEKTASANAGHALEHFADLFDGRTFAGWRAVGNAQWDYVDGAVHGRVGGGAQSFLVSEHTYGDFQLDVDVKLVGTGNSGLQVRSHQDDKGRVFGYQIEIDPSDRAWSGGLYDEGRRGWLNDLAHNEAGRKAFSKAEWNHYRIVCDGVHLQAWVNDVATADWLDALDLDGFLGLQVHAGKDTDLLWKNARIVDRGTRAWEPLFSAAQWKAAVDAKQPGITSGLQVADGVVRVRFRGTAWKLVVRKTADSLAHKPMSIAAGVSGQEDGWSIDASKLDWKDAKPDERTCELFACFQGDRLVLQVAGNVLADVRGVVPASGVVALLSSDTGTPCEIQGVDILGAPKHE